MEVVANRPALTSAARADSLAAMSRTSVGLASARARSRRHGEGVLHARGGADPVHEERAARRALERAGLAHGANRPRCASAGSDPQSTRSNRRPAAVLHSAARARSRFARARPPSSSTGARGRQVPHAAQSLDRLRAPDERASGPSAAAPGRGTRARTGGGQLRRAASALARDPVHGAQFSAISRHSSRPSFPITNVARPL